MGYMTIVWKSQPCMAVHASHWLVISERGKCRLLYHFDQVFTILEILVSEKADKFSFESRPNLNRSVFSAVVLRTCLGSVRYHFILCNSGLDFVLGKLEASTTMSLSWLLTSITKV